MCGGFHYTGQGGAEIQEQSEGGANWIKSEGIRLWWIVGKRRYYHSYIMLMSWTYMHQLYYDSYVFHNVP
jgi:hypothetical protein